MEIKVIIITEYLSLSECYKKSICIEVFSPVVDCTKYKSTKYIVLDIFQSFRCSFFKAPSWEYLWCNYWAKDYSSVFWLKNDSTRDKFFKFLKLRLSPQKSLWWIPTQHKIFRRIKVFIDFVRQVIVKNIKFDKHRYGLRNAYGLKRIEKETATSRALRNKLSFKSFGKYLRQIVFFGISLF